MKVTEFIDEYLVGQIGRIQDIGKRSGKDCHYLSFTLICCGIEFLGACLDSDPFDKPVRYGKRFKQAIKELFPVEYHKHDETLYKCLRCGIVHVALPKSNIGLTQKKESNKYGTKHLEVDHSGRLILVSETFYNDFKEACEGIKRKIKDGEIVDPKLQTELLSLPGNKFIDISGLVTTPAVSGSCQVSNSTTTNES